MTILGPTALVYWDWGPTSEGKNGVNNKKILVGQGGAQRGAPHRGPPTHGQPKAHMAANPSLASLKIMKFILVKMIVLIYYIIDKKSVENF